MTVAIRAENLTKTFMVSSMQLTTLKEVVLKGLVSRPVRTELKALDGLSFEVPAGTAFGVIGGNGSGKSTLLKLMAGISQPDGGKLEVNGRVAAMLELGAGFHPELTGMENIFLQGSIMGMSRDQILARLDETIEFAELGDFIHTPLMRYSSGMRVRLGFALACASDAEILLIDEVLSVGDSAFQAKCLRRIGDMRAQGRTIVFVSHYLEQVHAVSDEVLWLNKGRAMDLGHPDSVIPALMGILGQRVDHAVEVESLSDDDKMRFVMAALPGGTRTRATDARIESVRFVDAEGRETLAVAQGELLDVEVRFRVDKELPAMRVEVGISGWSEVAAAFMTTDHSGVPLGPLAIGQHAVTMRMPRMPLAPGIMGLTVALADPAKRDAFYDLRMENWHFRVSGKTPLGDDGCSVEPPGRFLAV